MECGTGVSVAVTKFKRPRYLHACITSVIHQTVKPHQIVISQMIVTRRRRLSLEVSVTSGFQLITSKAPPLLGQLRNRQQAVRLCDGELIAVLDDDDIWEDRFLEQTFDGLLCNPDCGFCSTDHFLIDSEGVIMDLETELSSQRFGRSNMSTGVYTDVLNRELRYKPFPLQFTLFRRSALSKVGGFPKYSGVVPDFALFLMLGANDIPAYYLSERLGRYRIHNGQQTGRRVQNGESLVGFLLKFASSHRLPETESRLLADTFRASVVELAIAGAHDSDRYGALSALKRYLALGWGPVEISRAVTLAGVLLGARRRK